MHKRVDFAQWRLGQYLDYPVNILPVSQYPIYELHGKITLICGEAVFFYCAVKKRLYWRSTFVEVAEATDCNISRGFRMFFLQNEMTSKLLESDVLLGRIEVAVSFLLMTQV